MPEPPQRLDGKADSSRCRLSTMPRWVASVGRLAVALRMSFAPELMSNVMGGQAIGMLVDPARQADRASGRAWNSAGRANSRSDQPAACCGIRARWR